MDKLELSKRIKAIATNNGVAVVDVTNLIKTCYEKEEATNSIVFDSVDEKKDYFLGVVLSNLEHNYYWYDMTVKQQLVELDKRLEEPIKPYIAEKLENNNWNGKFYGKKGKWRVYLDGRETKISDTDKKEYETYLANKPKEVIPESVEPTSKFDVIVDEEEFDDFVNSLKGNRFSLKVYGKKGSYCIYVNNEKYPISDNIANTIIKTSKIIQPIEDGIVDENGLTNDDYATLIRNAIDSDSVHSKSLLTYAKELKYVTINSETFDYVQADIDLVSKLTITTAKYFDYEYSMIYVNGTKGGKDFTNKSQSMDKKQLTEFIEKYNIK